MIDFQCEAGVRRYLGHIQLVKTVFCADSAEQRIHYRTNQKHVLWREVVKRFENRAIGGVAKRGRKVILNARFNNVQRMVWLQM